MYVYKSDFDLFLNFREFIQTHFQMVKNANPQQIAHHVKVSLSFEERAQHLMLVLGLHVPHLREECVRLMLKFMRLLKFKHFV